MFLNYCCWLDRDCKAKMRFWFTIFLIFNVQIMADSIDDLCSTRAYQNKPSFLDELQEIDPLFESTGQHCWDFDKNITELEQLADLILSGTVENLYKPKNFDHNHLYSAKIKVRRIFKGRFLLLDQISTFPQKHSINVDGFFDWNICRSEILEGDTRIFMLTQAQDQNSFKLNSSLLKMNLKNLDLVTSVVKKPCEQLQCLFGAKCLIDKVTGKAYCSCTTSCDNHIEASVCGTDNVTYASECFLKMEACQNQRRIFVASRGACFSRQKDPCSELNCQYGANCVLNSDRKTAYCACPTRCYNYGDSSGSRPVCGEDGNDYASLCHIRKESCHQKKHIRVKYIGLCDPCSHVTCPEGTICKLNERREPMCRCSEQCKLDYRPVCASDGNTYRNPCVMQVQSCKQRTHLTIFAHGLCEKVGNPCYNLKCDFGESCQIDLHNQSMCQCPQNCEPVMRSVCGRNGITYDNECELKRESCMIKQRNSVERHGSCNKPGPCASYECSEGAVCIVKNFKPICQCPQCTEELDPVCASNSVTYSNECKLRRQICQSKKDLFVKYRGFCEGCQTKSCDFYSTCVSDERGIGECQCRLEDCEKDDRPVCGTDYVTYDNRCKLMQTSCEKKLFIMVAFEGKCDSCLNVKCPWGGRCQNGECVCPLECPLPRIGDEPICGSDGVLYKSVCVMLKEACAKAMLVRQVDRDMCPAEFLSALTLYKPEKNCDCNPLGSLNRFKCEENGQCQCRLGVGGKKCDHCLQGFWGLHLMKHEGAIGCTPCGCSAFGSARQDCEQLTGRCVCASSDVVGAKCDRCTSRHHMLSPAQDGCHTADVLARRVSAPCQEARCWFGARCLNVEDAPGVIVGHRCICPTDCIFLNKTVFKGNLMNEEVCASDGKTYETICQLYKTACRNQKDLVVVDWGPCKSSQDEERFDIDNKVLKKVRHLDPEKSWQDVSLMSFAKNSTKLRFRNKVHSSVKQRQRNEYQLNVKCTHCDGVLLFESLHPPSTLQHMAIITSKNRIGLSVSLGHNKRFKFLKSSLNISDNKWHTVHIKRLKRVTKLQVDQEKPLYLKNPKGSSTLETDGFIWIGGCPNSKKFPTVFRKSFQGCLSDLKFDNITVTMGDNLNFIDRIDNFSQCL